MAIKNLKINKVLSNNFEINGIKYSIDDIAGYNKVKTFIIDGDVFAVNDPNITPDSGSGGNGNTGGNGDTGGGTGGSDNQENYGYIMNRVELPENETNWYKGLNYEITCGNFTKQGSFETENGSCIDYYNDWYNEQNSNKAKLRIFRTSDTSKDYGLCCEVVAYIKQNQKSDYKVLTFKDLIPNHPGNESFDYIRIPYAFLSPNELNTIIDIKFSLRYKYFNITYTPIDKTFEWDIIESNNTSDFTLIKDYLEANSTTQTKYTDYLSADDISINRSIMTDSWEHNMWHEDDGDQGATFTKLEGETDLIKTYSTVDQNNCFMEAHIAPASSMNTSTGEYYMDTAVIFSPKPDTYENLCGNLYYWDASQNAGKQPAVFIHIIRAESFLTNDLADILN